MKNRAVDPRTELGGAWRGANELPEPGVGEVGGGELVSNHSGPLDHRSRGPLQDHRARPQRRERADESEPAIQVRVLAVVEIRREEAALLERRGADGNGGDPPDEVSGQETRQRVDEARRPRRPPAERCEVRGGGRQHGGGPAIEHPRHGRQVVRKPAVVRVEEGDDGPAGALEGGVARNGDTAVLDAEDREARIVDRPERLDGPVGRAVVHHEELERLVPLR